MPQSTLMQSVAFLPEDNADWDHARNRRFALRAPRAQWGQSSLSDARPEGFYAPASDFAYEGLLCMVHGETWKFLDSIEFSIQKNGLPLALTPGQVSATPEVVTYRYLNEEVGELSVRYALVESDEDGHSVLALSFERKGAAVKGLSIALRPVFDIRRMDRDSAPAAFSLAYQEPTRLVAQAGNAFFGFGALTPWQLTGAPTPRALAHPLGRGERDGREGQVCFKTESHQGMAVGPLALPFDGPLTIGAVAGESLEMVVERLAAFEAAPGRLEVQIERWQAYFERFPKLAPAVVQRLYVMAEKFGVPVEGTRLPESGGRWFRTPHFRSVFEGFLHNHRTLHLLGKDAAIEDALRLALKYQEPGTGALPNRVPEQQHAFDHWARTGSLPAEYYEGDSLFTLMYTLVDELGDRHKDEDFASALWEGFKQGFTGLKATRLHHRHGGPVLLENGLLLSVPSHSWMNGKRVVWAEGITVADLPVRAPMTWQLQDILQFRDSHYTWEQYQYPTCYLPEVNAQWLRALQAGIGLAGRFADAERLEELKTLQDLAKRHFRKVLWNPNTKFLYNVVTLDQRIDGMPTAPAIEAAALLGESLFSRLELEQTWALARSRLLAKRTLNGEPVAFGLIAKDSTERTYYNDQQVHEAVVWPRETPYLIRLLRLLGQRATVAELLQTNLAHQTDEGVVFYHHEALSLPEGVNPSPTPDTERNPVPVRNPVQWESQWCDPYVFED